MKCTRSTLGSDLSRLRQVRSPECASPETSSTRNLSRTPSIETTARLFTRVSSFSSGDAFDLDNVGTGMLDVDGDVDGLAALDGPLVDHLTVAAHHDPGAVAADTLIVQPVGDGLALSDNAETGSR